MLICPICGKVNSPGTANCDLCGAPLADPVAPSVVSTPFNGQYDHAHPNGSQPQSEQLSGPICPVCRRSNRSISVFCAFCGYPLKGNSAPAAAAAGQSHPAPISGPVPPGVSAHVGVAADESGNLPSGILLKRRYRILRKIAQGGMGAVYEATDTAAPQGTRWAVKEMSPASLPASERTQAIADFRREAQMLAALQHPNLPKVVETFEELGKYFLVMEFIPGRTLQSVLEATSGFLPEERIRVWARQLFDVINYLHSQSPPIIYRDIKPANIMLLEGTERIKLIDFGIARFHKAGKARDTEAFGTAGYAPPEQYGKGQTDQRSDIYALGATLHYLVTKHDPGLNPFNWLPARQYNPGISAQMNDALQHALNLDPQRRFLTVLEFAGAMGLGSQISTPVHAPALAPSRPAQEPWAAQPAPLQPQYQPPVQAPAVQPQPLASNPALAPATQTSNGSSRGQRPRGGQSKPRTQAAQKPRVPDIPVAPASAPVAAPMAAAASIQAAPPVPQTQVPVYSAPAVQPTAAPAKPANGHAPVQERHVPTANGSAADHGTVSTAAPLGKESIPALVVSDHLVDLGEARWNSKAVRRINLLNVGGGEMKGTVVATQPWVALNVQSFHGNTQTVEIRVKNGELPFGRVELHVPNLFAMIWARTKWALPFIGIWFWIVVLVASSIGKMLLLGALGVIGALVLTEVLIWWWAMHVRFLVPAEKLNSGRLLVKSSGGEQQIEVRVKARPTAFRTIVGWVLAAVLFTAEIGAVAWGVLAWAGILPLPVL